MFESITWKDYCMILGGALAIYYGYLALVYYRRELLGVLRRTAKDGGTTPAASPSIDQPATKRVWRVEEVPADLEDHRPYMPPSSPPAPSQEEQWQYDFSAYHDEPVSDQVLQEDFIVVPELDQLQSVVNQLRELFSNNQLPKDQLLEQVQLIIQQYPGLRQQPYRVAINNLVVGEAKDKCRFAVTEKEVETLWQSR